MLIQSITLTNFQCYFGENNIEFSSGLNVIIGDNGYGKSKLYDAFYWVLYDEVFDSTERKFLNTSEVKNRLISDKAKANCIPGDEVKTIVKLSIFNHQDEEEYIITRSYVIRRKDTEGDSDFAWEETSKSQLEFLKRTKKSKGMFFNDRDKTLDNIKKILPPDIKPYIWFQGEQVDSLIDFKNVDTITRAVNALSDIRDYNIYVSIAEKASESAQSDLRKERRRLSRDTGRSDTLEKEKKDLVEIIERRKKEMQEHTEGLSYAKERQLDLMRQLGAAEKIHELDNDAKQVSAKTQELDEELKRLVLSVNKNLFNRFWAINYTEQLFNSYAEKFGAYEKKRLEKKVEQEKRVEIENEVIQTLQMRLPHNVPEPEYVRWMLEAERCLVCDREAHIGSEPWLKIKELLEYKEAKPKKVKSLQLASHDFHEEFKSLYQNGLKLQTRMENMNDEIRELVDRIVETRQQRKQVKEKQNEIQSKMNEIIDNSSLSSVQSTNVISEFKGQQDTISRLIFQIHNCDGEIKKAQDRITEIDSELNGLTKGQISPTLMEKVEVLEDFKTIAKSTRERVFNRLITQLEKEANKHYAAMTSANKAARGQISLVKQSNGSYMPKIHDSEGQEMYSINDSNIILIKMSVIMAIISAKKSATSATQLYPLISDAPTSKFTENYTIGFCQTVSEVFSQSIIMSKEFYFNTTLRERLFKEVKKLGNIYTLEPSVPEGGRDNRNSLETIITKL